jgi:DNA repair protein RecN (Recombination protein N)
MLLELRIRDFAVIRDLSVELGPGLNVLTGETGTGKSILLGALSLLLGERASSESVRAGADRAVVEAVFDLEGRPELRDRLEELGIATSDELLVLRREVQSQGRNRAWINESPAAAGTVGEFGRKLVDLHGQHEHQTLLHAHEQRTILDAFAEAGPLLDRVAREHGELTRLKELLKEKEARRRELEARSDFLRFQLDEILDADLQPGEDREVEAELRRLDHAEELARSTGQAHDLLYGEEGAASERLAGARELIQRLVRFDESLKPILDELETAYHLTEELGRSLGDYSADVEVDPRRAEELRQRSDMIFRLKRKYGPELTHVLETRDRLQEELAELEEGHVTLGKLEERVQEVDQRLREVAGELTEVRARAAERLIHRLEELLPQLGLTGAVFRVQMDRGEVPGPYGFERVSFQISMNQGFEPQPLSRVASGGELSRVMLALKAILAAVDQVPTLVFDEIDAGIGGTVAVAVARKLQDVSAHHQVLVITHLPQLASAGVRHLRVEKQVQDGLAATAVVPLSGDDRVWEIARMLGGDPESETSRRHARELLDA